jgi:hypothetical protein
MATDPAADSEATIRLPFVGEATGLTRSAVSEGQPEGEEPERRPPPAPILAVHGVGDFANGDVIGEIAGRPSFARRDDYHRLTVIARGHRYTLLMDSHAEPAQPRLMEVNWSDVRRPMPNAIGLLRHFVIVLMTLTRIGVNGAYRSRSLCRPLWCGPPCLWLVEGLLVWSAAVPVLSALLWQLEPGQRMAAGLALGAGSGYLAFLLRTLSLPMAAGAVGFGALSLWAGWLTCYEPTGHHTLAYLAGALYAWSTLAAGLAIALAASEIALQPRRAAAGDMADRWLHRVARMGCLWLPAVLLTIVQPLAVSALLLPMEESSQQRWGQAFSLYMPFSPEAAQYAGNVVAWSLVATLLLGAMQFKLIQRYGRNVAVYGGWGVGLALLALVRAVESELHGCELCQRCLRPDLVGIAGLAMVMAASVTWILFSRAHTTVDLRGRQWYPAGTFARFWASVLLYAAPAVLLLALVFLVWDMTQYRPRPDTAPDAAVVFIESTKYALLLVPLATRPFAAFLDALGDVFFFVVRQRSLSTRQDTQPRLATALRYLHRLMAGGPSGHMIVLAHSQGTVVAAAILSRMVRLLRRTRIRLTLVTLGSPLTTLYRNFLGSEIGAEFAGLCRVDPDRFRWINLTRPSDYIGGPIEWPGVDNRELLTPGDHIGYWIDEELLAWLKALSRR